LAQVACSRFFVLHTCVFASAPIPTTVMKFVALALLATSACATELTGDNFDSLAAGKSVFVKFQAPW